MFQRNAWASITALCICSVALCISQASAQEKVLKQYYGNGVHAYYSGNYVEAYDLLSKSINAKIEDPRPYYFRGFALMKLGRPDQAVQDFKAGAELELKDTTGRFPVNFALERCQGQARLALENARNEVQLAAFQRRAKYSDTIYNSRLNDQKTTLIPENLDLSGSTLEIEDDNSVIDDNDDNGDSLLDTGDNDANEPADDNDLFGGDDDKTEEPADTDNDVFGDADKTDEPADKTDDDADPFGAETGEEPADNKDDADPFGAETDDEPADKAEDNADADDAKPADDDADPFAEETPEETKEAEPLKNANLDDDAAADNDNADAAEDNADAAEDNADAAEDNADAADDADADDNKADEAEEDDPFDF